MRLIGLLGGTFNPIHFGHLRMAQELADALDLTQVRFIPSANPPHKQTPLVNADHRAAMVSLAIDGNPLFMLDDRELKRSGASYTIDTLTDLNAQLGDDTALCLLMGSDVFRLLHTWHRWQTLLDYCHIVLVQRPDDSNASQPLAAALQDLLHDHYTEKPADLSTKNSGYITMQHTSAQAISATIIRQQLAHGKLPRYLLPESVMTYIQQHHLYTQDKE